MGELRGAEEPVCVKEGIMRRSWHTMDDINDRLPIIPHRNLGADDCCGCLVVEMKEDQDGHAEILCNECLTVIQIVPIADVEKVMAELAQTDVSCNVQCPHCGTSTASLGSPR